MSVRLISVLGLFACLPVLSAQVAVAGSSKPGLSGVTPSVSSPSPPANTPSLGSGPASIGFRGRVLPNLGQRVMVELYEDGSRVDQTFTQNDGTFTFATQSNNHRYEVRIRLSSDSEFRTDVDLEPGMPLVISIDPRHIYKLPTADAKPSTSVISVANLTAPRKAMQEVEKARDLSQKKKYDDSLIHLQKALQIYPAYPDAFNQMGLVEENQAHMAEAEASFRKAIEADPKWTTPYMNILQLQVIRSNSNPHEMLKTCDEILKLDANMSMAHYYSAISYYMMGRMDDAEKEGLLAERTSREPVPTVQLLLGRIYEARGHFPEAVQRFKAYLKESPRSPNAPKLTAHVAELEKRF